MYTVVSNNWNSNHTDISKYFIERLIQKLDFNEVISNRHRTTNGYILIDEVVKLCNIILKRSKNVNRLRPIIEEALCTDLDTSISNDYILKIYFPYIKEFYFKSLNDLKNKKDDDGGKYDKKETINKIYLRSQSFQIALKKGYYKYLKDEIRNIDLKSKHIKTETRKIDLLLDCLIPYLIHSGYTISKIRKACKNLIKKDCENHLISFLKEFDFSINNYCYRISVPKHEEQILNPIDLYVNLLGEAELVYKKLNNDLILNEEYDIETGENFNLILIKERDNYQFDANTIDQYSVIRQLFVRSIKTAVIKNGRISLQEYTDYFDQIFYKTEGEKYKKPIFSLDPIDVTQRQNTLLITLEKILNIKEVPLVGELSEPIYYYNMALGSKSLENSLLLMWSALEALIPYNYHPNDINNIQHFVSKFLSVGSVGRSLSSFIKRFNCYNLNNTSILDPLGTKGLGDGETSVSLYNWFQWVTKDFPEKNDPYDVLKSSPLLCNQFLFFNEEWGYREGSDKTKIYGNLDLWMDRINSSEKSIYFQLDRIYLHRNQIVHSAIFLNEYSNLWSHLEWYVGKLLSYCMIFYQKDPKTFTIKNAFLALESEYDEIKSFLESHKGEKISEIEKTRFLELFNQNWQYF